MNIWDTEAGDRKCPLRLEDRTLRDTQKLIAAWQKMEGKHMANCERYMKLATWIGDIESLPYLSVAIFNCIFIKL